MEKRTLGEVLTDQKFNVPEYQRLYSWKNIHHEQYWSDIEQFANADLVADRREVSDVFFSSMYFAVNDDKQVYEVIDSSLRPHRGSSVTGCSTRERRGAPASTLQGFVCNAVLRCREMLIRVRIPGNRRRCTRQPQCMHDSAR
ncbi:GmrSD restriction endonuclease domain-containing protein [Halostagnicola bangensis]